MTVDKEDRRRRMIERQLAARGIGDARVLAAMAAVPREAFVPPEVAHLAYEDTPLPILMRQTISQPYIVALMAEALRLDGSEKVLEVGTGSGYGAAVLGRLAREVHTIERHEEMARTAAARLEEQGAANVHVVQGDGTLGLPSEAPFDAIAVTAGGTRVPPPLIAQLAPGGRLVIPVGETPDLQRLVRLTRVGPDDLREDDFGPVRFVPLIGAD